MFCVADGFAGKLVGFWQATPSATKAFCVALPAQAGNRFSKYGIGFTAFTSVPEVPTLASFESMVPAWKYFTPLAGSVKLGGMPISTCIERRRPILPT